MGTLKGKFIVFEGIDRCGKTTQAKLLQKKLKEKKIDPVLTFEPGATNIGHELRDILLHSQFNLDPLTETFLFEADRTEHVKKVIIPALKSGKWVISDRYFYSTLAYQSGGKGVNEEIINQLNQFATNGVIPDLVILIDILPETAVQRKGELDRIEKEGIQFLNRVREKYLYLSRQEKNFVVIDGEVPIPQIEEKIWKIVLTLI